MEVFGNHYAASAMDNDSGRLSHPRISLLWLWHSTILWLHCVSCVGVGVHHWKAKNRRNGSFGCPVNRCASQTDDSACFDVTHHDMWLFHHSAYFKYTRYHKNLDNSAITDNSNFCFLSYRPNLRDNTLAITRSTTSDEWIFIPCHLLLMLGISVISLNSVLML